MIRRTARPSRTPAIAVSARPMACACMRALAVSNRASAAAIGRLRQFRPATISRATAASRAARKLRSMAAASIGPREVRRESGDPAGDPRQPQDCQRPALQRHASRPVGDGGQQKPRHGRDAESEQHFVHVPEQRIGRGRRCGIAEQKEKPEREAYGAPTVQPPGRRDGTPPETASGRRIDDSAECRRTVRSRMLPFIDGDTGNVAGRSGSHNPCPAVLDREQEFGAARGRRGQATAAMVSGCSLAAFSSAGRGGKRTVTVVPTPRALLMAKVPPCSSAKDLTSGRPRPVPSCLRT